MPKYTIAQSYLLQISFTFYYFQIIFIPKKYYSSISNCKHCFTFFNNKMFLYTKTNPPMYHYSISSHSIKLTEALPNTNRKLPSPLPPPPKITYPCPNIYIPHFNSKYYNCINLTQFHVSVTIHLIFLTFLFFTPFFLPFLFFTQFFLLFLFFTPFN